MNSEEFSDGHRPFDTIDPIDAFRSRERGDDVSAPVSAPNASDVFFDDFCDGVAPGVAGNLRQGLEVLLASIEAGRFDGFVLWEVPRLVREEMRREASDRRSCRPSESDPASSDVDAADVDGGVS